MRYSPTLLLVFLVLQIAGLHAQPGTEQRESSRIPFCAFDEMSTALNRTDPATARRRDNIDQAIYYMLDRAHDDKLAPGRLPGGATSYSIPVVVHIVHDDGPENLTDDEVRAAIQNLNDAFANVGDYDPATGVAVEIHFCLARQDVRGKATTGITRVRSALTEMVLENDDISVKDLDRWDPYHYLNIWVVRSIISESSGPSVSGFAYYPSAHGAKRDGVIVEASLLNTGVSPLKILVHELGHYLGLYHTFQGQCRNDNCMLDGDEVCDTPPDASSADLPCSSGANTCTTDADDHSVNNPFRPVALGGLGDQRDMIENYMDYGNQSCKSAFTNGQRERMIATLTSVRASLLESKGCDDPCTAALDPTFSVPDTVIAAGTRLTFTNTTIGTGASYEWLVDGKQFATTTHAQRTFTLKGTYVITLRASSGDSTCRREYSRTITVRCPMMLSFTTDRTTIQPGETVLFTNTSTGAQNGSWYIDGLLTGTAATLPYTFTRAGGYQVYLIGSTGDCIDTAGPVLIRVGDCKGGREESLWYFGAKTGLDFRMGAPEVVPDGPMSTHEGGATICDRNGRLLFYSDGSTVWRADGSVMENGYAIVGSQWAAQGTLIVKMPGSDSLYCLFTTSNWKDAGTGLRYTVIDMSRNGGLGAVTSVKNVLINRLVSERVAAVYHENCMDVWIVTHEEESDKYQAYLLTADGLAPAPVTSRVGLDATGENRYGCLKFSSNGKRIASAFGGISSDPTLELLDFDPGTGVVSNAWALNDSGATVGMYSAEFSPDNNMLYATAINGDFVYQFDLTAGDAYAIKASYYDVAPGGDRRVAVQLGPDGKIYVTRDNSAYLDVIEFPNNKKGSCGYKKKGVDLAEHKGSLTLPVGVAGYSVRSLAIDGPGNVCMGQPARFEGRGGWCARGSYIWQVSGPAQIASIDGSKLTLNFVDSGRVTLYLDNRGECGSLYDTLRVTASYVPRIDLGNDTTVCASGIALDAGAGFTGYRWQDGSNGRTLHAASAGTYWVEATTAGGCVQRDSVNVAVAGSAPKVDLGGDTAVCAGDVVALDAGPGYRHYTWQDGSDLRTFSAYLPGRYWVTAETYCGDLVTDTIRVATRTVKLADLGPDTTTCPTAPVTLTAGPPGLIYKWSTGEITPSILAATSGTYWVYASDGRCESRDTVRIAYSSDNSYLVWLPDLASAAAFPLDTEVIVPLRMQSISFPSPRAGIPFEATVRFNGSMLLPTGNTPAGTVTAGDRSIHITGVSGTSDTLALFSFRTLLGDSASTAIAIDSLRIGDPCQKDVAVKNGSLALQVCRANGTPRLVSMQAGAFGLAVPEPNPAGASVEIRYSLIEQTAARLTIVDARGSLVATLRDGPATAGSYSISLDTRRLPAGLYFITLETPTNRVARKMIVR